MRSNPTLFLCPHCNKRVVRMPHTGDVVHDCADFEENAATGNEDILIVGNWSDFDGSGIKPPQEVMMQGVENELQGTDAGLQGEDVETLTVRGNPIDRYRTRRHFQYIRVKDE